MYIPPKNTLYPDFMQRMEDEGILLQQIEKAEREKKAILKYCEYEGSKIEYRDRVPVNYLKVYCDGFAVQYPYLYREGKETGRGKGGYKRNNKISIEGSILRSAAVRKIKSCVFYRFWYTKQNRSNDLKFFTFTVQDTAYEREVQKELSKYSGGVQYEKGEAAADQFFIQKLSMFLENKSKQNDILNYVWVAEKTKKGVIHFHALIEGYFSALKESSYWASLCEMEDHRNSIHYGFKENHGQYKDVEIKNPKTLAKYLTKYISKGATQDPEGKDHKEWKIYGRAYGMSRGYTQSFKRSFHVIPGVNFNNGEYYKLQKAKKGSEHVFYVDSSGKEFKFSLHYFDYYDCLNGYFKKLLKYSDLQKIRQSEEALQSSTQIPLLA